MPIALMIEDMFVKNGDIMDLCATKWSGFMCKPGSEVEGVLS